MPGLHITDRQMRLYMRSRHTDTLATAAAAAKAGFSTATGYRIDARSAACRPRGKRRAAAGAPIRWLAIWECRDRADA